MKTISSLQLDSPVIFADVSLGNGTLIGKSKIIDNYLIGYKDNDTKPVGAWTLPFGWIDGSAEIMQLTVSDQLNEYKWFYFVRGTVEVKE